MRNCVLRVPVLLFAGVLWVPNVAAQVDEVVVTAERKEGLLQDTSIAVSALSSDNLQKLQVTTTRDIGTNVPSLQTFETTANSTAIQVFMRGAGVQNPGFNVSESPVGIYLDGVFQGRLAGASLELTDVERIEVLRGPQGTLYGRNTISGAMNIVTRTPGDEPWLNASLGGGEFDTVKTTFSAGGPLGDGFSGSIAGLYSDRGDGYIVAPNAGGRRLGEYQNQAVRGKLRWNARDEIDAVLSAWYFDSESDGYNGVPYGPSYNPPSSPGSPAQGVSVALGGPQSLGFYDTGSGATTLGAGDGRQVGFSLDLSFDVGEATVRSITGYIDIDDEFRFDLNGGACQESTLNATDCDGDFVPTDGGPIFLGTPAPLYVTSDSQNESFSQELQLLGSAFAGGLDYLVGVFFLSEDGEQHYQPRVGGLLPFVTESVRTETTSIALFSEATWYLSDAWSTTFGIRWTRDDKEYMGTCTTGGVPFPTCSGIASAADPTNPLADTAAAGWQLNLEEDWDELTPKFQLNWQATDDLLVYGTVSRGFQAGGFQGLCFGNRRCNSNVYDPQTVWSYEVGAKGDYFDRTLRLNLAAYLADYEDIQQSTISAGSFPLGNVGEATVWGLELEAYWSPTDMLNTFLVVNTMDTELDGVSASVPFASENELGGSPDYTAKVGFDHSFEIAGDWRMAYGADVYFSDAYFATVNNALLVSSYHRVGGFVSLASPDEHWQLLLQGKNLTDEEDLVSGIVGGGTNIRTVLPPREWMLTLSYRL